MAIGTVRCEGRTHITSEGGISDGAIKASRGVRSQGARATSAAALTASLVVIGDKLGLYKALAAAGPATPAELADAHGNDRALRARVAERRRRRPATSRTIRRPGATRCPPEHAVCAHGRGEPGLRARRLPGHDGGDARRAARWPRRSAAAAASAGTSTTPSLFVGVERFFRPGYNANLVDAWIPALDGVQAKLERGARVADVGCGHGASTIIMAQGVPEVDLRRLRLPRARRSSSARERARAGRRRRPRAASRSPRRRPSRATTTTWSRSSTACTTWATRSAPPRHVRESLAPDGTWLLVEPLRATTRSRTT